MKFIASLFILCLCQVGLAQRYFSSSSIRSDCSQSNTRLDTVYKPGAGDTCLLLVSTRHYNVADSLFLDYDYDTTATLTYFAIYFKGNCWTVVPKKNLETLMRCAHYSDHLVAYTEGLGRTFTTAVDRGTRMMREYGVQVVQFDWPTQRPYMKGGKNFRTTYRVSKAVAKPYARFADSLQAYKNRHPGSYKSYTFFFHSMGNLVLMHAIKDKRFAGIAPRTFDNVILNAACVPQRKHAVWLSTLNISTRIYVTKNNNDKNLNGARLVTFRRQLGERPRKPFSPNAVYVDFSQVLGKEHNYFLLRHVLKDHPYIRSFYDTVLKGKEAGFEETHYKAESTIPNKVNCYLPEAGSFSIGL